MNQQRDFEKLAEILTGDPEQNCGYLDSWLTSIPKTERVFEEHQNILILGMDYRIISNGFVDLFFQYWSLADCRLVLTYLAELGCEREVALLEEAFQIYVGGNQNITQEEYENVDWGQRSPKWDRFDEIGEEFSSECLYGANAMIAAFKHFRSITADLYGLDSLRT